MPRVRLAIRRDGPRQRGFLSLEVILAAVIFGFLSVAIVGAFVYGRESTARAGDYDRASELAEEGVEAVRNIRDAAFSNLTNGTYGLAQVGGQWVLSGSSDTIGIYTRQVVISQVDATRKTVVATVSWTTNGKTRQVSASGRLTDWQATLPPPPTPGPIMMVYSKTTPTPYYRIWNGTDWGPEGSASSVTGNINYVVLKSSRTREESILGVQTSTGAIFVQVWNGSSWGAATQVGTGPTTTRSFDIAYEKDGDRAIIAYTPSSGSADFAYRTWDGTMLSSGTTVTAPPTTGAINWIEMRQNPLSDSNEVALIMQDANDDVYGMRWTGSAWNNMGAAAVWDTTASSGARKGIDVEYEQLSGRALFVWGDATATDQYYRIWNGTTLTSATLLDISGMGGAANWVQLAARSNSNEIMYGVQDAGADLNTARWTGSAWNNIVEHDDATENIQSKNFDIVWETHTSNPGVAWILWGDENTVSAKRWSGSSWAGSPTVLSGSNDTSFVKLRADPVSGAVFAGIYNNFSSGGKARDLIERHLTGGSSTWPGSTQIWSGSTSNDPVFFRIDIATP